MGYESPDQVLALPGEYREDEEFVRGAVQDINAMFTRKGLETAVAIGEYVLEHFFGGDPERFRERGRSHLSFRALANRDDLMVSHTFLWRSVALVDQLRQLPQDVAYQLSVSHHHALFPLKDREEKVRLATAAADQGWTKRELEAEVKEARLRTHGPSKAGRPALPAVVKGVKRLTEAVELVESEAVSVDQLRRLSNDDLDDLVRRLDTHLRDLEQVRGQLVDVIAQRDS